MDFLKGKKTNITGFLLVISGIVGYCLNLMGESGGMDAAQAWQIILTGAGLMGLRSATATSQAESIDAIKESERRVRAVISNRDSES